MHGAFKIRIDRHRNGLGCLKCKESESNSTQYNGYLKRFHELFGNKYDYTQVNYSKYTDPISIICPLHGPFQLLISSHLKGVGCPRCNGKLGIKSHDLDAFINRAKEMHGNFYDYSRTIFVKLTDKITIACPKHGDFTQAAHYHLKGHGCIKCGHEMKAGSKFSSKETIKKFRMVHGNKYNYDNVDIVSGTKDKIIVRCPSHGNFFIRVDSHLSGAGCLKCSLESKSKNYRINPHDAIVRMKLVHSDFYDYSKTNYNLSREKITVTCPLHGDFEVEASHHLRGSGCRLCAYLAKTTSRDEFIHAAILYHGDLYDYSEVDYVTAHTKVKICCSIHGMFFQTPNNHIRGQGCPHCGEFVRHLENKAEDTPCIVYYLTLKHKHLIFYKVGITTNSVENRFRIIASDNVDIIDKQEISTTLIQALVIEQKILSDFQRYQLLMTDVLFKSKGGTECFCDDVLGMNDLELKDYL